MTNVDFTPAPATIQPAEVSIEPDLAANVAKAQHNGDLAYDFAERVRAPLSERAVAYHVAFAETMRELGSPLPCPCDLCTGGENWQ
jgi:hypothetical protein